jgi:hypothetical protein
MGFFRKMLDAASGPEATERALLATYARTEGQPEPERLYRLFADRRGLEGGRGWLHSRKARKSGPSATLGGRSAALNQAGHPIPAAFQARIPTD